MRAIPIAAVLAIGLLAVTTHSQQITVGRAIGLPNVQLPRQLPGERFNLPVKQAVVHDSRPAEQQILIDQFARLPDDKRARIVQQLADQGYDLPDDARRLVQEGRPIPRTPDITIFRAVQDELKPVAVRGGHVVEVFPASSSKWAQPLNAVERARLLHAAESVGRIETRQGTDATLNGTGFVVAQGVIATNCHVLREIAQQSAGGAWALKPGLLEIDFSDSSMHEPVHEYTIQSIAGYPESQFLDVALLRVAPTSKTGGRPLPGPLPVTRTIIQRQWQTDQLLIDVIGYPDLDNLVGDQMTQNMFRRVRESGDYAKLLSPGAVTGVDTHGRLDFLNHVASTHPGESGAPVVDRETGAVVGIHYCCSSTDVPQSMSPLACSSQLLSDRDNNEALSSWTVVADSVLGPLLKDVAAGSLFFTRPAGRPASRGGEASTRRQALP